MARPARTVGGTGCLRTWLPPGYRPPEAITLLGTKITLFSSGSSLHPNRMLRAWSTWLPRGGAALLLAVVGRHHGALAGRLGCLIYHQACA